MHKLAQSLLNHLLTAGEMSNAGRRQRKPSLTVSQLAEYRAYTSLQSKEAFEETMRAARACEAIILHWDEGEPGEGFIKRIDLNNLRSLANFLGARLTHDCVDEARANLLPFINDFPVLQEVMERWASLRKVRGLSPDSYSNWKDAIKTIAACREAASSQLSVPVREFSNRLFKDTKRIERLIGPIDILLSGSLESEIRNEPAVLQELGLFREEHPALLAGNVVVEREWVTAYLDKPYSGLPTTSVVKLGSAVKLVMTIENLTTFHSEARKRRDDQVLLIYTAGMPSPAWRAMYRKLLQGVPAEVPIYHWGDVDEGGFRIAATLAKDASLCGHTLLPWKMHPNDIPDELRRKAKGKTLERIQRFSTLAGWQALGEAVSIAGFTVEQEGV